MSVFQFLKFPQKITSVLWVKPNSENLFGIICGPSSTQNSFNVRKYINTHEMDKLHYYKTNAGKNIALKRYATGH